MFRDATEGRPTPATYMPIRVLIATTAQDEVKRLVETLRAGGYDPTFTWVDSLAALTHALEDTPWDLLLAEHAAAEFNAASVLALLPGLAVAVPVVLFCDPIGEEATADMLKAGVDDLILEGIQAGAVGWVAGLADQAYSSAALITGPPAEPRCTEPSDRDRSRRTTLCGIFVR